MPEQFFSSDVDKKFFEDDRPLEQTTFSTAASRTKGATSNPFDEGATDWSGYRIFYYESEDSLLVDPGIFDTEFGLIDIPSLIPSLELSGGGEPTAAEGGGIPILLDGEEFNLDTVCRNDDGVPQITLFCAHASLAFPCRALDQNLGLNLFEVEGGTGRDDQIIGHPQQRNILKGGSYSVDVECEHVPGVLKGCDRSVLKLKWIKPDGTTIECRCAAYDGQCVPIGANPGPGRCFAALSIAECLEQCMCGNLRLFETPPGGGGKVIDDNLQDIWTETYGCEKPDKCPADFP